MGRETHVSDEEVESCEAREELSFAGEEDQGGDDFVGSTPAVSG